MGKPDFTADIAKLADRSEQLRALVADQRKEEGGEEHAEGHPALPKTSSRSRLATIVENDSDAHHPHPVNEVRPPLSATIERLIDSDNSERSGDDKHEWSRRLTYLSTRIPEDLRDLIDDLLFVLKKEAKKELGREPTLQDLACEAWGDLIAKYRRANFPL
jgi:hypothetical protein